MRRLSFTSFIVIIILFLSVGSISYSLSSDDEKIYKNIYIDNVNVGNLTKKQALEKLNKEIYLNNTINIYYENKIYGLNLKNVDLSYDLKLAINDAYNIARGKSFFKNVKQKLDLYKGDKYIIAIKKQYNDAKLDKYIEYIESNVNTNPKNATIQINSNINITKDISGIKVNKPYLKKILSEEIMNNSHKKLKIPVYLTNADITYEYLSKINTVLGKYETAFNKNVYNRCVNITVASDSINSTVLNPNEQFSFNSTLKNKNAFRYMKEAPIILNGKVDKGVGGGICQVSTTLYNAVLYSGLQIVNVRNHSIPSAYAEKGRDATVSMGQVDFKFKNNYNNPIYIKNEIIDNKVVTTIYGNESDKKEIEIVTNIVKTINPKTIIKSSNSEIDISKPRNGYVVNTYRIYKENYKKELVSESYYPPKHKIIKRID